MTCDGALELPLELHPHLEAVVDAVADEGASLGEEEKEEQHPQRRQMLHKRASLDRSPLFHFDVRERQL